MGRFTFKDSFQGSYVRVLLKDLGVPRYDNKAGLELVWSYRNLEGLRAPLKKIYGHIRARLLVL